MAKATPTVIFEIAFLPRRKMSRLVLVCLYRLRSSVVLFNRIKVKGKEN